MSPEIKNDIQVDGSNPINHSIIIRWWHWVTGLVLVLLLVWLVPRGKSPEFTHLKEGSISHTKIIAPFDFEVLKDDDELRTERDEAKNSVLPVLLRSDTINEKSTLELMRFTSESHRVLSLLTDEELTLLVDTSSIKNLEIQSKLSESRDELFNLFRFRLSEDTWRFLMRLSQYDRQDSPGIYFRFFEKLLVGALTDIYSFGLVDDSWDDIDNVSGQVMLQYGGEETIIQLNRLYTVSGALKRIATMLSEGLDSDEAFPDGFVSGSYEILQPFLVVDTRYDKVETDRRRQLAIAKVPLADGFVIKDELIIDQNIKVLKEHVDKLNSLAVKRAELQLDSSGFKAYLPVIGNLLLVSMIIFLLGLFIVVSRITVWNDWKLIVVIAIIIGVIHLFQSLVPVSHDLSRYMFPVAVGAMLLSLLMDRGIALAGVGVMAMLAGLIRGHDYSAVLAAVVVGGAAILAVRNVRTRADVMRAGIYLAGAYFLVVVAFHFVRFNAIGLIWNDLAVAAGSVLLSPMLVIGFVWMFENIFKLTTNLSLLELIDLNRPLLRELALKAPGTYHHSILVGSLAEAAANAIGANALLIRAGAYYHDIGKMKNKGIYIENQEIGSKNVHDKLAPSRSAEVIVDHVTYGLELADKYGLPEKVKSFISEHHGRTKLAYFYNKACEEQGVQVDENKYRYPGPNPQSVETGILMLADVVEAATRSLDHPTSDQLISMVSKLIHRRVTEGDLDNCPLTFRQISQVREAFIRVLTGIYHQRIEYPDRDESVDNVASNN